ncbi:recombinase family protein [Streptomyces bauhiniae]|uniref:Recombinase family protein n=1 Tax=Streptomyces bauhiniae TaxID=2340725 RepID=A0A7K3QR48_9ACTN|nr:recombinase family protein [Streptomyces bauhiniae]NEB92379.1 recombinase family protein [Streptomyces bauhiniae]
MPYAPEYLHLVIPGVQFEAILYARNSFDASASGNSVSEQLTVGRTTCHQYKWPIQREFKDIDTSASRHGRKARDDFEALIAFLVEEPPPLGTRRIVVAFQAARYYRDLEAYVRLRSACLNSNTLLCYNKQVYDLSRRDDRKTTAQHAVDAEDEAEGIRDGNLRSAASQAQLGLPHGKLLFGYDRAYKTVNGRKRCIGQAENPVQGPYVLKSLQRVDQGHSITALVAWLRSHPEAARENRPPWDHKAAREMLINRAYLGERVYKGESIPAQWAPIKGLETPEGRALFNRVTAKLTAPERVSHRGAEVAHLLTYLALCGECGDHAVLQCGPPRPNGTSSLRCKVRDDTSLVEDLADAVVEEAVIAWFGDKTKARSALVPSDDKIADMATSAQRLINAYEEQLTEARRQAVEYDDLSGKFKLSAVTLASLEAALQPKLEAARRKLQGFTGVSPLLLKMLDAADPEAIWNGRPAGDIQPEVPGLTIEQKREVIKQVVTVRLYKAVPGRRKRDPNRIRLSFVGEPGFRAGRLRVPASGAAPAAGTG